jgi:cbb3-type cytochrome oxidase subunit 3
MMLDGWEASGGFPVLYFVKFFVLVLVVLVLVALTVVWNIHRAHRKEQYEKPNKIGGVEQS